LLRIGPGTYIDRARKFDVNTPPDTRRWHCIHSNTFEVFGKLYLMLNHKSYS